MNQMYQKTMRFQLMKLLPGLLSLLLTVVLYIPLWLWIDNGLAGIGKGVMLLVWALFSALIYYLTVHYYGYVFQTAFLAAAAEYAVNQALPTSYRDFVQQFVKGQFQKPADFLYLYRLIKGAIRDLHKGTLWKNKIMLDYMTYCCVCINFYKKKAGKYKTMADAVVLFSKNQKKLLAKAEKTAWTVAGSFVGITLIVWWILSTVPVLNAFSSLVIALVIAGVLKYAFLDSWFLSRELLVCGQLEQMGAEQSYEELSRASRSFKKLYHKVRREQSSLDVRPVEFDFHSLKFCGECGALVAPETTGAEKEETDETVEQTNPQTPEEGVQGVDEILEEISQTSEENQGMGQFDQDLSQHSEDSETGGADDENSGENSSEVTEKVSFCGECGSAIFPEDTFCGECGTPVEQKEPKKSFCGECGTLLQPGEKFCGECGTPAE